MCPQPKFGDHYDEKIHMVEDIPVLIIYKDVFLKALIMLSAS